MHTTTTLNQLRSILTATSARTVTYSATNNRCQVWECSVVIAECVHEKDARYLTDSPDLFREMLRGLSQDDTQPVIRPALFTRLTENQEYGALLLRIDGIGVGYQPSKSEQDSIKQLVRDGLVVSRTLTNNSYPRYYQITRLGQAAAWAITRHK